MPQNQKRAFKDESALLPVLVYSDKENFIRILLTRYVTLHCLKYSGVASHRCCCRIRRKTHDRLLDLRHGVLSAVLRQILSQDPIAPVLHAPHYAAMDARLVTLLAEIDKCISKHGAQFVLIEDQYSGKPFS